ncbi:hypothetical protein HNO88_003961 [Novosphingobium chloroacetimidivorans]|uniref:Uncharacterized protein n=1 Tax=Novosphingobium chloroacetimidivorans TaxID=1428314 RepID=A0A7W7NYX4_9SPHN|nr:hypothetical protein [Novosphingobium chloroacetimidivorans]MBB4860617.1 hypothetical protein [Novosphingobium chloroacetimidivorans]
MAERFVHQVRIGDPEYRKQRIADAVSQCMERLLGGAVCRKLKHQIASILPMRGNGVEADEVDEGGVRRAGDPFADRSRRVSQPIDQVAGLIDLSSVDARCHRHHCLAHALPSRCHYVSDKLFSVHPPLVHEAITRRTRQPMCLRKRPVS